MRVQWLAFSALGFVLISGCVSLKNEPVSTSPSPGEELRNVGREIAQEVRNAFRDGPAKLDSEEAAPIVESVQKSGLSMASDLLKENPNGNLCVSPLSIGTVGLMLREGAAPDADQILAKLTHQKAKLSDAKSGLDEVGNFVQALDKGGVLQITNSAWIRDGKVKKAYADILEQDYNAEARKLTGSGPAAAAPINDWVKDKTKGMIPKLFDQITPESVLVVVNTITFEDQWTSPWDDQAEFSFRTGKGETIKPAGMTTEGELGYLAGAKFAAAEVPYRSGLSMRFYLPNDGVSLGQLVQDSEFGTSLGSPFSSQKGQIIAPEFKHEFTLPLGDYWKSKGGAPLFDPKRSNFPRMTVEPQSWISQAIHKTFIEVNKKGTKAAAATGAMMAGDAASAAPVPFILKLDRPFLYVIRETGSGLILFIGVVNDPR